MSGPSERGPDGPNEQQHRLLRHDRHHPSRAFKGRVKGGAVYRCTCGWMTITSSPKAGIAAHAAHRRAPAPEPEVVEAAPAEA